MQKNTSITKVQKQKETKGKNKKNINYREEES